MVPVLLVTHKLHYVDELIGVTTTMKMQPVRVLGRTAIVALPIAPFFRIEPVTIYWIGYAARLFKHFVHMNITCHFGELCWLPASPNQHRIHYIALPKNRDKNLASYFLIFDVIFGTYYQPGKVAAPTGAYNGETYNSSLITASLQPFTDWWRMAGKWMRGKRSTEIVD